MKVLEEGVVNDNDFINIRLNNFGQFLTEFYSKYEIIYDKNNYVRFKDDIFYNGEINNEVIGILKSCWKIIWYIIYGKRCEFIDEVNIYNFINIKNNNFNSDIFNSNGDYNNYNNKGGDRSDNISDSRSGSSDANNDGGKILVEGWERRIDEVWVELCRTSKLIEQYESGGLIKELIKE